jgi:hypothetical protein
LVCCAKMITPEAHTHHRRNPHTDASSQLPFSPHDHTMSEADTPTAPVTTPVPDAIPGVSKETYNETKRLADDRGAENATLKAQLESYQERDRTQLRNYQPLMEEHIKELHASAPVDVKAHLNSMLDWSRNAAEKGNLSANMQLGTLVHCSASALKRERENASVKNATADQLAESNKRGERLEEENQALRQRTDELTTSLKEITDNNAKLQEQIEKAGLLRQSEKFDFSKASSREADPPTGMDVKTENASKGVVGVVSEFNPGDVLSAFINSASTQYGTRFMPSASNHSILGSTATEASLSSAIRPM